MAGVVATETTGVVVTGTGVEGMQSVGVTVTVTVTAIQYHVSTDLYCKARGSHHNNMM